MTKSAIKINTRIDVARLGDTEYYSAAIQDLKGDVFYITIPTLSSRPLVLSQGEELTVKFPGSSGIYIFNSSCTGAVREPIIMYVLTMPKDIKRIQQRKFVRVETLLEVHVAEIPEKGKDITYNMVNALDISGGGMRLMMELLSEKAHDIGKELMVRFSITDNSNKPLEIKTKVRVVRKELLPTYSKPGEELLYSFGVEFLELNSKIREIIIGFIFRKMAMKSQVIGR